MSAQDRSRWDASYADRGPVCEPGLPAVFAAYAATFHVSGVALDIACGQGAAAVWLAQRGLDVTGFDVSAVAVGQARALAEQAGVAAHFEVADLDDGLPPGPPVDVLVCHRFRDPRLYPALIDRLAPDGLLAICVLSEAGGPPGPFRAPAGELHAAFAGLDTVAAEEGDGQAWLLARRA